MISTFLLLLLHIAFFVWIIRNILFFTHLWQLKEYRFDRFFVHLRDTQQGRDFLFSPNVFIKWFLIVLYPFDSLFGPLANFYPFFVASVFFFDAHQTFLEVRNRTLRLPVFTLKSFTIVSLSFLLALLIFTFPLTNVFLWFLIADRTVPFVVGYFVFFLSIPTEFYRDFQITRATSLRRKRRNLTVVGITGSYGKTSTKEFVASILSEKFSVLKTSGTNNTPIGIAMTMLEKLKPHHEIFVVEMGAYKRGEIRELCQIVRPGIGILTAVNTQHLSLFGSLENVTLGKYELIESLPRNGIALFNGNNKNAFKLYQKTNKRKYLYATNDAGIRADIVGKNIVVGREGLEFNVVLGTKTLHMKTNLLGAHNLENLLPGILLAKEFGMTDRQVKAAVEKLTPIPATIEPKKRRNGVTFIDDTFNANPKALEAALIYLKTYRGRKILVLQPMIELGREASDIHYALGKESSVICDHIFLTNRNFAQSFVNGATKVGKKSTVSVSTPREIRDRLSEDMKRGSVVLFEGKEAGLVLTMLEKAS